jgi:signal transduction histidine kinase
MEQAYRDEALSIISHELRNELSVLATWAALLRHSAIGAGRHELAAAAIDRGTEIARRLCDDLGAILADVEPSFVPQRVDLREIVAAGVRAIGADARRKGVHIVERVDAIPVWVDGDRVRLGEVLSNLLGNALAFTGRGDTITVEVRQRDGQVRLVVADTGAGISPSFLPRVFDKFSQEARRQRGGRGLGLYVVRRLIELHKGSIEVQSDGRALGARFTVTLASAAADAA